MTYQKDFEKAVQIVADYENGVRGSLEEAKPIFRQLVHSEMSLEMMQSIYYDALKRPYLGLYHA